MIRTQIQLTEKQYKTLKEISSRESVSMAEVIREAVESYTVTRSASGDKEKFQKALSAVGKFKSGHKDISLNHDKYLSEDFIK